MQERFCPGLALAAAYWADPIDAATDDPALGAALAASESAARNVRCHHPAGRSGRRRRTRQPAAGFEPERPS
jgi:hypothetical protein